MAVVVVVVVVDEINFVVWDLLAVVLSGRRGEVAPELPEGDTSTTSRQCLIPPLQLPKYYTLEV